MLFFGFLFFMVLAVSLFSFKYIRRYASSKKSLHLKKFSVIWAFTIFLISIALYIHYPITKDRIIGLYEIDNQFYSGPNADWQKEHFSFEITERNEFLFHEKLKDGSVKTVRGKIEWYRHSPPMLYRIVMDTEHPLIDQYPALYRGNRKFYYVFKSKFGNMFYRKVR